MASHDRRDKPAPPPANTTDALLERGLPASVETERLVLGTVVRNGERFDDVRAVLQDTDFSLEKHRRIFRSMIALRDNGEHIDRMSLVQELARQDALEACDGITYIVSLDEGLPELVNLASYLHILREKGALRNTIFASQHLINECLSGERTKNLSTAAESVLLALGVDETDAGPQGPAQIIESFPGGVNAFLDPQSRQTGLKTGFNKFDEMTGGLQCGELVILAARPSMGKTAWALNVASNLVLRYKKSVMFFSLEMSKSQLLTRLVCSHARVDSHRFRLGYLDAEERRRLQVAVAELADTPLLVDDKSAVTMAELHAKVRRRKAVGPLDLVVVDYLQLMAGGGGGNYESRNQEVSTISRGLKLMAAEIDAPIMALSQLSRAPELRKGASRPQLSDLRESGAIEQDADTVAFLYRQEMYDRDRDDLRGQAELIIGKQRNGPTGTIKLVFLHNLTKFENRVADCEGPLLREHDGQTRAAGDAT